MFCASFAPALKKLSLFIIAGQHVTFSAPFSKVFLRQQFPGSSFFLQLVYSCVSVIRGPLMQGVFVIANLRNSCQPLM